MAVPTVWPINIESLRKREKICRKSDNTLKQSIFASMIYQGQTRQFSVVIVPNICLDQTKILEVVAANR